MFAPRGLIRTIRTTRNFWNALALMYSNGRKTIVFRDGSKFQLTWLEYWTIRDIFSAGARVEKVSDNLFKVKSSKLEIVVSSQILPTIVKLVNISDTINYFEQVSNDLFRIRSAELELLGSSNMLSAFCELQDGTYGCDCRDKVVLDVGGFQGESAAFFSRMGARKVIIYEPVAVHHEFIKRNMFSNRVDAELHEEGIGNVDGTQTIHFAATDLGFGVVSSGQHEMEIKIKNAASVIEESHADVAKFDCEGAEESLVNVPSAVIRKIDFYMIEVHTSKIREAIIRKFNLSGFSLVKEVRARHGFTSVIHFKKNPAY